MKAAIIACLVASCLGTAKCERRDLSPSAPLSPPGGPLSPPAPPSPGPTGPVPPGKAGCDVLTAIAKSKTFLPGSDVYNYENTQFWSNTQLAEPACVFRPSSAQDVAAAVKALADAKSPFALRGGGHSTAAQNIDAPGVLMVMSNLTGISLNADSSVLTLQPGYRWGQVYDWLAPHDLVVAGGRLAPVGVPGLLLAGGINFHGNQVGFSADTVLSYEVVLASGKVVTATAKENADLFWGLKGGSSNFGIVTSFKLKTIPSKKVWAGTIAYAQDKIGDVYEAIAKYSAAPTDPKAHLVPAVVPSNTQSDPDVIVAIVLYDSETEDRPACFQDFFDIANVSDSTTFKTVAQFAAENGALVTDHINNYFIAGTFVGATSDELLKGIQITNDTFYTALDDLYANIPASDIKSLQLDWQPISKTWIEAGLKLNPAGSPILEGLSEYKTKTYLCYAEVVEWTNTAGNHDAFVNKWIETTTASIDSALKEAGLYRPYLYMGDSAPYQTNVLQSYGQGSYKKMLNISRKYDPDRVFQKLVPAGYKLGA